MTEAEKAQLAIGADRTGPGRGGRNSSGCGFTKGRTAGDLESRRRGLGDLIGRIARRRGERPDVAAGAARRAHRASCTAELPVDRAAIAQEIVRIVGRSDISEEVTRFRGAPGPLDALTDADEPCGRKLDFLLQEMNREINTIGSKADGPACPSSWYGEGRAREDAGAGPECRVSGARAALHRVGAVGHGQDDARRAAGADGAESAPVAVVHLAPGAGRRAATAWTIISSAASASTTMIDGAGVPRVGGRVRELLRHVGRRTPRQRWPAGQDLVLVIDVQGARQVRARGVDAVGIFVLPAVVRGARKRLRRTKQGHRTSRFGAASPSRAARSTPSPTMTTSSSTTSWRRPSCSG